MKFGYINMEIHQLQQLREGFGLQDTLDHKFETLIDITKNFFVESNEQLKESVNNALTEEYKALIFEFKAKLKSLESRLNFIVGE